MKRLGNKRVEIDRKYYEVYWVSQYIDHYNRKFGDGLRDLNFEEIKNFAVRSFYIPTGKGSLYRGLGQAAR